MAIVRPSARNLLRLAEALSPDDVPRALTALGERLPSPLGRVLARGAAEAVTNAAAAVRELAEGQDDTTRADIERRLDAVELITEIAVEQALAGVPRMLATGKLVDLALLACAPELGNHGTGATIRRSAFGFDLLA